MGVENIASKNSLVLCLQNLLGCISSHQDTLSFPKPSRLLQVPHWPSQPRLTSSSSISVGTGFAFSAVYQKRIKFEGPVALKAATQQHLI